MRQKPVETAFYGGIAQLGERLNGIQEVSGSIPLISTKKTAWNARFKLFFSFYLRFDRGIAQPQAVELYP